MAARSMDPVCVGVVVAVNNRASLRLFLLIWRKQTELEKYMRDADDALLAATVDPDSFCPYWPDYFRNPYAPHNVDCFHTHIAAYFLASRGPAAVLEWHSRNLGQTHNKFRNHLNFDNQQIYEIQDLAVATATTLSATDNRKMQAYCTRSLNWWKPFSEPLPACTPSVRDEK